MLPPFTANGDLPPGIHPAGWSEIERRFGVGSDSRVSAYAKLGPQAQCDVQAYVEKLAQRSAHFARALAELPRR